jgi:hypothetical protein
MARRSSSDAPARALVIVASLLPSCDSCRAAQERAWAICTCDYVTDMDYPGKVSFEVCGEPSLRKNVAKSCALGSGVGAVLECACRSESGGPCSDRDTCRDVGP